jgi:hypothetical protein
MVDTLRFLLDFSRIQAQSSDEDYVSRLWEMRFVLQCAFRDRSFNQNDYMDMLFCIVLMRVVNSYREVEGSESRFDVVRDGLFILNHRNRWRPRSRTSGWKMACQIGLLMPCVLMVVMTTVSEITIARSRSIFIKCTGTYFVSETHSLWQHAHSGAGPRHSPFD